MERKLPSSAGDFLAVLARRKYWIIVPAAILIALTLVISPMVPRTYQSTTTIMVQPQRVPATYVRPLTSSDAVNRIETIQLEILDGPELPEIINRLNLYPELRQKAKMNQAVHAMSKDITIAPAPDSSDGHGGISAFTISYIGRSPREAQQVTQALANLFIQGNLKLGHQQTQNTADFLSAQVAEAGKQLAAQQAKIQDFKQAHAGSLPEQAQANAGQIGQYQAELQANNAAIDQDNQQRVYLQSVLNVNPNGSGADAVAPPTPLEMELAAKQAELHADLLKYTPEHPDIIRLQHDIASLKQQIRQQPKTAASAPALTQTPQIAGPTTIEQLRSQLIAYNSDIRARNARQQQIQQKLNQLQGVISTVPAVQTEYAALDSTYQNMQKDYNALLDKQQDAQIAVQLDRNEQGEQLLVIAPAYLPTQPFRPNPALLYMGGILVGLLAGLLCGLIVELRDDTIHTSEEAAAYLKLPVIVDLPKCPSFDQKTWEIPPARS